MRNLFSYFYFSIFYNKLINRFCKHGKKQMFEVLFFNTFLKIARYGKFPVFFYFFEILEKQLCYIGFRQIFKKKKLVLIPYALSKTQKYFFACSLLHLSIIHYGKISLAERINTVMLAYFDPMKVKFLYGVKRKLEIYKLAIEKRVLIHYR